MAARVAVLLLAVSLLIPLVASGPLESAADESEPPASTAADLLDTDRLPLAEEDNTAVIVEEPTRGEGESDDGLTEPVPVAEATPATGEPPVGASHEPAPLAPGPEPPIAAPSASPAPPARAVGPRVEGPQYGMNIFIWGSPATTARDLERLTEARFGWQKSLFEWRAIEPRKGVFDWAEAERVVEASNAAGLQVIARVDFPPRWARADGRNGPPNRYQDYADFVFALADHFKPGSPHGTISAIQLWNEPNLSREWGSGTIGPASAAEYVRLMCGAHRAAKRANAEVITISAGLAPTGVMDGTAAEDTAYLQWMYDSGARGCFDALGAHAPGLAPREREGQGPLHRRGVPVGLLQLAPVDRSDVDMDDGSARLDEESGRVLVEHYESGWFGSARLRSAPSGSAQRVSAIVLARGRRAPKRRQQAALRAPYRSSKCPGQSCQLPSPVFRPRDRGLDTILRAFLLVEVVDL